VATAFTAKVTASQPTSIHQEGIATAIDNDVGTSIQLETLSIHVPFSTVPTIGTNPAIYCREPMAESLLLFVPVNPPFSCRKATNDYITSFYFHVSRPYSIPFGLRC